MSLRIILALVAVGCGEANTGLLLEEPTSDSGSIAMDASRPRDAGASRDGGVPRDGGGDTRPYRPLECSPLPMRQLVDTCSTEFFGCLNVDDRMVHVTGAEVVGDPAFSIDRIDVRPIGPGDSASVGVRFCPTAVRSYLGELRVRADEVLSTVDLYGEGFIIEQQPLTCQFDSVTIGPVAVGESTLWSIDCAAASGLTVEAVELTPSIAGVTFDLTRMIRYSGSVPLVPPAWIEAGDVLEVTFTYAPITAGTASADLLLQTSIEDTSVALEFIAQ